MAPPMRKKFCSCIKKVDSLLIWLFVICMHIPVVHAAYKPDLTTDVVIFLSDGRKLSLRNVGDRACYELSLSTQVGHYLWDRTYCTDFGTLWLRPFFVPIKAGKYEVDLDHDGYPEVGVAVWDGGNSPRPRWAIIFSVEDKALKPYGRKKYYIESGDSLLP